LTEPNISDKLRHVIVLAVTLVPVATSKLWVFYGSD
jgi:hypothetical protein